MSRSRATRADAGFADDNLLDDRSGNLLGWEFHGLGRIGMNAPRAESTNPDEVVHPLCAALAAVLRSPARLPAPPTALLLQGLRRLPATGARSQQADVLASHPTLIRGTVSRHISMSWLLRSRRIAACPAAVIRPTPLLDTGPNAYRTSWSRLRANGRVNYRAADTSWSSISTDRKRRARLISGPSLSRCHQPHVARRLSWRSVCLDHLDGPRHFCWGEPPVPASDPGFARMLGPWGRVTKKLDDGRELIEFSAEATASCFRHRYRSSIAGLERSARIDTGWPASRLRAERFLQCSRRLKPSRR